MMEKKLNNDEYYMKIALSEAEKAFDEGEIPIGAVVVYKDRILARAHNQTELLNDCTAHAEMLCITGAMNQAGTKYLRNCTLYVTLEPCVMCAGALNWAQIGRLVYAASDDKCGYSQKGDLLHKSTVVEHGLMASEAESLLKEFFRKLREK